MTKSITIETNNVCAKTIECEYDEKTEIVHNVKFNGGCSGNTQAISRLVKGKKISEIVDLIGDIKCGSKNTSCAKELCKGLIKSTM